MRKKTILIHSNFCKAFTGFGKHKKNILKYLFKTGKYNIVEAANGKVVGDPSLEFLPWECHGAIPKNFNQLSDNDRRAAGYGQFEIDSIIEKVKPDLYIGIEDIWAFGDFPQRPWWNKINTMIWTTLDSLPILQQAIDFAPKTKHYYVWASFAEKALRKMGYSHIKTLRGSLEVEHFYRFSDEKREELRSIHKINKDDFIVGFVFRNQLRKSVPNLLDGFKLFQETCPNAKLLLHTHWKEGWDITKLLEEKGIDNSDVLTTYYCKSCHQYRVNQFTGEEKTCPCCNSKKSFNTTNINFGVSEQQLNQIYNLMDVYCHPFTSGGQEIPIQEAKLTELITLVTNYSCGEDSCSEESAGIPLDWHEYREPGTQFIKASTCPDSICKGLKQVYEMESIERAAMGLQARQWVIDNFSVEVIGKQLEEIIDSMPFIEDHDYSFKEFNENYSPTEELSDSDFILDLYKNILFDNVDQNSSGFKLWLNQLTKKEIDRKFLTKHFQSIAKKENLSKKNKKKFEDLLSKDDENKRIAVVIPKSGTDVLLVNSLLKNLAKKHKDHNIYVITQQKYFELIEDNPYVYKLIPYSESLENPILLEGAGSHKGYFKAAYFPHTTTQKFPCYIHNGN